MSIVSISGGELLPGIQQPNVLGQGQPSVSFGDFLNQAIEEVNASEAQAQQDILSIATGDADALHNITLNMARADLALHTLVQVRNKAMEAYNEVMRITL